MWFSWQLINTLSSQLSRLVVGTSPASQSLAAVSQPNLSCELGPVCHRYGQEQEDRQWDSGGGGGQDYYNNYSSYYRQDGNQDRYENKLNRTRTKKSTSNKELTRGYSESVEEDVSVLELVNIYKLYCGPESINKTVDTLC